MWEGDFSKPVKRIPKKYRKLFSHDSKNLTIFRREFSQTPKRFFISKFAFSLNSEENSQKISKALQNGENIRSGEQKL